jgi:uncharacterized membrane protein YccC
VSFDLSARERHFLSERQLRERAGELRLGAGVLALIGVACAAGLVARWGGVNLPDVASELLGSGTVVGIAGAYSVWREWRYVALLRKLVHRIAELEAREVDQELPDDRSSAEEERTEEAP